jgi:hypothetical protein
LAIFFGTIELQLEVLPCLLVWPLETRADLRTSEQCKTRFLAGIVKRQNEFKTSAASFEAKRKAGAASYRVAKESYRKFYDLQPNGWEPGMAQRHTPEIDALSAEVGKHFVQTADDGRALLASIDTVLGTIFNLCSYMEQVNQADCSSTTMFICQEKTSLSYYLDMQKSSKQHIASYSLRWPPPEPEMSDANSSCALEEPVLTGEVVQLVGRAFVNQNGEVSALSLGSNVWSGDIINVEQGSQVAVQLVGGGVVKLTAGTSFGIPRARSDPIPESVSGQIEQILQNAWQAAQDLLSGDCGEVRANTPGTGVRG